MPGLQTGGASPGFDPRDPHARAQNEAAMHEAEARRLEEEAARAEAEAGGGGESVAEERNDV